MASNDELTTMIKCFRINELQMLLSFAGRSKSGKKQELQDRALSLLSLQSEPLAFKIRHLYHLMQKCYYNNYVQYPNQGKNVSPSVNDKIDNENAICEKEDDSISIIEDGQYNGKILLNENEQSDALLDSKTNSENCFNQSKTSAPLALNPLYYPLHPNVKFKKLPFYKVLHELLKPASLVAEGVHSKQKHTFVFYLTPQQSAAFSFLDDIKQGTQQNVQGLLRFCLLKTFGKQEDCLPDGLIVMVNNKYCNIEEVPKKKKKDIYAKEPSIPINITPFIKTNTTEENKIDIYWNTNFSVAYVMAAYVVRKKTSQELLTRLQAKSIQNADYTCGMIKDKLKEEADSEIITTSLRVSLMCPLGKVRIQTPCRAFTCQHFQCFDAYSFLQMNEKKPAWICPVCDNPAEYDSLFIDGYFVDILSCSELPSDANEIELHSDGSWSFLEIKSENCSSNGVPAIKTEPELQIVDILVDDDSTFVDKNTNSENMNNYNKLKKLEKRKVDEIDLTISDSDDEPLIYLKRRESLKNKKNVAFSSGTNSISSSPSVIQLDDTESSNDSLALVLSSSISASATASEFPTDFNNGTDLREERGGTSKTSESIMPWFAESAVFF